MLQIDKKHRQKIVGILQVFFGNDAKFYAYGSRSRGDNRPTSDLDIMIKKGDEKLDLFDILEAKELLLASRLPFSVDLHDYNATDADFLRLITDDLVEL